MLEDPSRVSETTYWEFVKRLALNPSSLRLQGVHPGRCLTDTIRWITGTPGKLLAIWRPVPNCKVLIKTGWR
jgi:hypothetical protein